jgi:hypothetical protein
VEQFFTSSGWLLPAFHQRYWLGLARGVTGFRWLDRSLPGGVRAAAGPAHVLHMTVSSCELHIMSVQHMLCGMSQAKCT